MVDEVNNLIEDIGPQNPEQTNPRYLVAEQLLPVATEFDQKPEDKLKAEAYLAKIQQIEKNIPLIEAENAKAKAEQLARDAAQKALVNGSA
jgi:geranylgeranyl pyrophosphate synthase